MNSENKEYPMIKTEKKTTKFRKLNRKPLRTQIGWEYSS
jgi:hypothetical protein